MNASTNGSGPQGSDQKDRIRRLRKRLAASDTFLLPEAWDVASARVMADAGFDVVGISNAAFAWSMGLAAEARLDVNELLQLAARIAAHSPVPIVADIEGATGRPPEDVGRAVEIAVASGCVGITVGDGGRNGRHGIADIEHMTRSLQLAKAATLEAKMPAVLIASTECFLLGASQLSPFEQTVARAEAYFAAGADCVLVPGLQQPQIIERLVHVVDGPLGVTIGLAPAPDMKALRSAGVAYVTFGASLARSLLGTMRLKAEEMLAFGHFAPLDKAIAADALDRMMA